MKTPVFAASVLLLLSSCQPDSESRWRASAADVADARERAIVSDIVDEVQNYSSSKGQAYDFRRIPVRVVEEFSYAFDDSDVGGACYPGDNAFIEIKRPILRDPEEAWNILVHELGHCVLEKNHDDEMMKGIEPGMKIRRDGTTYPAQDLTVSIMSSRGNRMAPRIYYLDELFGGARITDVKDLSRKYPGTIVFLDHSLPATNPAEPEPPRGPRSTEEHPPDEPDPGFPDWGEDW